MFYEYSKILVTKIESVTSPSCYYLTQFGNVSITQHNMEANNSYVRENVFNDDAHTNTNIYIYRVATFAYYI